MSRRTPNATEPNPVWTAFASRHPGHRHLDVNPLIALPVDALGALAKVERLFEATDLKFEQDLTASVIRGFFHRRPMSTSGSGPPPGGYWAERTIEEEFRESGYKGDLTGRGIGPSGTGLEMPASLTEMMEQLLADKKIPVPLAREIRNRRDEVGDRLIRRKEAYAGWLVVQPGYRRELAALRNRWGDSVEKWGRIPHPATTGNSAVLDCAQEVGALCRKWCLERLWAWDWPEPRSPDLLTGLPTTPLAPEEGITLRVPWSMLRGKQINFHEVIQDIRLEQTPTHLRGWVVGDDPGAHAKYGESRHRTAFSLYRTLVLGLDVRYPRIDARLVEDVDEVLASVLVMEAETVKLARRKLFLALAAKRSPG